MTTESTNLSRYEQEQYVEASKKFQKRMNFNGLYYLAIFQDAVKRYNNCVKETDDLFETCKKKNTTVLEWYLIYISEIEPKMKQNKFIAVTFAAMFLGIGE